MTIYALSTIEGQSGVAIIRVSGTKAKESVRVLTGRNPKPSWYHCVSRFHSIFHSFFLGVLVKPS